QAKLALILYTYELAQQLQGTGVTVNVLHPGVISSNFGQGLGSFLQWGWKVATPFLITVEQCAQTTLYLATSPEAEGLTGKYFTNSKETRSSRRSYDETVRERLWKVSEELVAEKK